MTYSYLKPRLAKLIPELANNETALRLALPAAIGGATGLGALAYNAVAPLDVDPVGLAVGAGLALGTQGRTPYNYAGLAALGLEGARYLNNAFTNTRDTESSPLVAMGIGAGALGLREALRRGAVRYEDVGFPTTGRMAQDLGKPDATTPIEDVVAAPPKPPTKPMPKPTPSPRVATEADVAPINPLTGQLSVVVPSPTIEDYIAKSPLLNKERAMRYADPSSEEYEPDFVKMLTQDLSNDFRAELAFPDDVLRETYRGSGIPVPVATGAVYLPILRGSFDYPTQRHKLNSDVIVFRGSSLIGGEGKSNLVNQGVVPEGTYYPNAVTSNPSSLKYISTGKDPRIEDPGFYIQNPRTKVFESVLEPNPGQAKEAYNQLITSGRMAVPMTQKSLNEPMLYVDELSGGSSPYDIDDFYGYRATQRPKTVTVTLPTGGVVKRKYYGKAVYDPQKASPTSPYYRNSNKKKASETRIAIDSKEPIGADDAVNRMLTKEKEAAKLPYLDYLDSAQEWMENLPSQKYYQTTDFIDEIVDSNFNKGLEAYGLNPKTMPSNLKRFRQELGTDDFSQTAFVNQYLKAQGKPELPLPPLVLPKPIDDPQLKGIFYY